LWISSEDNQHKCKYLEACLEACFAESTQVTFKFVENPAHSRSDFFLHEQRGEQGLLKIQAIHQVKDPEKIQTWESRQRFSNWGIRLMKIQIQKTCKISFFI
jgi:hypothetical protein